ncbi:MAG: FadR family transcriptional regulator [Acidobacteria bacterium]|nr:FadR family transcriptional regulator [Acidobacteriota bacterium]
MAELHDASNSVDSSSIDRTDITEQVLRRIKELLISGELAAGSRLPSERILAERLEISRPSLRAALKALSVIGIIRSRPGSGTFIVDSIPAVFTEPIHFLTLINRTSTVELFEARAIIEGGLAELAAGRADPEDIARMRGEIVAMEVARKDPTLLIEHDMRFHQAVARAADNQLMTGVMETLTGLLHSKRLQTVFNQSNVDIAIAGHRRIADAIEDGDGARAKLMLEAHLSETLRHWEVVQNGEIVSAAVDSVRDESSA